jgi:hypothetical protein
VIVHERCEAVQMFGQLIYITDVGINCAPTEGAEHVVHTASASSVRRAIHIHILVGIQMSLSLLIWLHLFGLSWARA